MGRQRRLNGKRDAYVMPPSGTYNGSGTVVVWALTLYGSVLRTEHRNKKGQEDRTRTSRLVSSRTSSACVLHLALVSCCCISCVAVDCP